MKEKIKHKSSIVNIAIAVVVIVMLCVVITNTIGSSDERKVDKIIENTVQSSQTVTVDTVSSDRVTFIDENGNPVEVTLMSDYYSKLYDEGDIVNIYNIDGKNYIAAEYKSKLESAVV